ncbi:hypothetical protein [Nocardia sp. NPDC051463]|uniref:hypothetical protein n=1 Tax=Nocardia sp. NPDC051463 TaxID=3154845 RepID=UPI00344EDA38
MRRPERAGLAATVAATAAGLVTIGACSTQISGTAAVDQTDLAAYTSEVTASSIAASSSRAAAAARTTEAACTALRSANASSVHDFNEYITVSNNRGLDDPEVNAKADVAVNTLRGNARTLDAQLTNEVAADVAGPLRAYRDDTNGLADTLAQRAPTDTLNAAIDRFNATKDAAIAVCKGH